MSDQPDLAMVSSDLMLQGIRKALDRLPRWQFTKRGSRSRSGAQRLAVSVVCGVAFQYQLTPEAEFETRYIDEVGQERTGRIDVVVYEPNRHLGLLLAVEIVTDRVTLKDLLKLRDAPVTARGQRLVLQLNPEIRYPVVRPLALTPLVTDSQARQICLGYYRRRWRTLLERRDGSRWAEECDEIQEQSDRLAII